MSQVLPPTPSDWSPWERRPKKSKKPPRISNPPGSWQLNPQSGSARAPKIGRLASAALTFGVLAFLTGFVIYAGGILALTGLILALLSLFSPVGRKRAVTALVLSLIALVVNIGVILFFNFVDSRYRAEDSTRDHSLPVEHTVASSCYDFTVPEPWVVTPPDSTYESCSTTFPLHGIRDASGTFSYAEDGPEVGTITVEAMDADSSNASNPAGTVDGMALFVRQHRTSLIGTEINYSTVDLDSTSARLIWLETASDRQQITAVLVARAPSSSPLPDGGSRYFIISFSLPNSLATSFVTDTMSNWRWQ